MTIPAEALDSGTDNSRDHLTERALLHRIRHTLMEAQAAIVPHPMGDCDEENEDHKI